MNIEQISFNTRVLLVSLPNNDMPIKSPFAIQKALIGIGGEPKSVKRLRSGDLLIETTLIVPQLTQTYAQATRPSTISTASQTDPNISNIICPPLQCLTPISSKNPLPGTSSSVSTFSTSSSSTQDNLLPSPSGILPTIQSESLLQIPIPTTTTTTSPGNNLNTLVSHLETETRSHTTPAKLNSVSTENFPESVPNESNGEHSTAAEAHQFVKRKSRNRRKRPKVQKPDIETKRVPHRSRNETPTEITTDGEDMIIYDVEEEELEQDPFIPSGGSPSLVTPHRSLNFSRGVLSEPDLLTTPDAEILDGFSGQGVIQVRRITIKKDATVIPTKHMILTFNNPNLPITVKAGYLNCKIRPYVPNPLRCFKCQRFGHSQTACRGRLTCSRCAAVGHPSTDCTLEPRCVNCSQSHPSDSKLCSKWKTEKEIQVLKTNRNIPYVEARKLIAPQLSQYYAQVNKLSTTTTTTQTDENITKIVCPPLKLLQPLVSVPQPTISSSVAAVNKSSTSTQAELVPSTSSVTVASPSKSQPPTSVIDTAPTTSNSLSISAASSSSTACSVLETTTTISNTIPATSEDANQTSKLRRKKRPPKNQSNTVKPKIEIKTAPHRPRKSGPTEYTTDEEDMIIYDVWKMNLSRIHNTF
ncbi:RNA-directed DNA polymerase from mobile element jockey [Trichonephila clavipes]|nr:RNA-directed DNA polymerase from mobile element jockey [Trichonephila clavipes]